MRRTALVTGGNRGIGRAVCDALGAAGLSVLVGSRDRAAGEEVAAALGKAGVDARAAVLDVARPASIDAFVARLAAAKIDVDVLVNNAGIYPLGNVIDLDLDEARRAMEVHVFGPLALARACAPGMAARGYGRIVNVSSGCGSFAEGLDCDAAYSISKAALNALTVKLAQDLPAVIKVNAVCPGWVRTRMGGPDATRTPEQGADTIAWLATLPDDGPTGGFFRDRAPIGW